MDTKEVLFLWFINLFASLANKSTVKGSGFDIKPYKQLAEELHKPIIKKF